MGKILIIVGIVLVILGAIIHFFGNMFSGGLPGDIVVERKNFKFYFPLATSVLISLLLTLIFYLIKRFKG